MPRKLMLVEKLFIGFCLAWLVVWTTAGAVIAVEIHDNGGSSAATVLTVFLLIGCIALIGLWPHRDLLRDPEDKTETHGQAFDVLPRDKEK